MYDDDDMKKKTFLDRQPRYLDIEVKILYGRSNIYKLSTLLSFFKEVFSVLKFWTTNNVKDSTKPCSSDNEAYEFN